MDANFKLLRTQKNDIFTILEQEGLNPSEFKWDPLRSEEYIRLRHKQSGYSIDFSYRKGQECYFITYSPAEGVYEKSFHIATWDSVLTTAYEWASCLKEQIEAADLWAEMGKYTAYLSLPSTEDLPDEPISAVDAKEIEDRLWNFANEVEKRFNLVGDDLKFLRHQNAVLIDIAKRSSKKAFVYSVVGVVTSIAMSLAMSPEQAKALWQLLHDALSPFLFLQ